MDWTHILVILSSLLVVFGASSYVRDTIRGHTKPNRISWFLWAFFPLIGTGAALQAKADIWATIRIFLAGFLPLIIFFASFVNKKSYWRLGRFDWFCGVFALIALIVWFVLDQPKWAILVAVIGDVLASLPTIFKAWKYPETETGITYVLSLLAALLMIPSIPTWNIENSAFQIYLLAMSSILILAVYRKKLLHR